MNYEIEYKIKMNDGPHKGEVVTINTTLEEVEDESLSMIVIHEGHLYCWCNKGEFEVIGRSVLSDEESRTLINANTVAYFMEHCKNEGLEIPGKMFESYFGA